HVRIMSSTEFDEEKVTAAASKISTAKQAAQEKREQLEQQRKEEKQAADPYDASVWAAAGIDPVKITIDSRSVYTLRTYLGESPVGVRTSYLLRRFPRTFGQVGRDLHYPFFKAAHALDYGQ